MQKELSAITRTEWIKYHWIESQQSFGGEGRIFMRGDLRTPDEAYQAMEMWDATEDERGEEDEE